MSVYVNMYFIYIYMHACCHVWFSGAFPKFCSVSWGSGVEQLWTYRSRCARYPASSLGNFLKMSLLKTDFGFSRSSSVRGGARLAFFVGVKNAQICGETGVFGSSDSENHIIPKNGPRRNRQNIFLGQGHWRFCVFRSCSCASIFQRRALSWKSQKFAETTEKIVPKWRGRKRIFGTWGPQKGFLRNGRQKGPIHSHSTSFAIHIQQQKRNCSVFLAFSLLKDMSLSMIFTNWNIAVQ